MAVTQLADIISPQLWTPAFILSDPVLTAFFASGIAANDPLMQQYAQSEAATVTIRWIQPMDGTVQENVSSDDPTALSVPQKAAVGSQTGVKLFRNNSWASMDLTAALFSPDPVLAMRSQIAGYWMHRFQAYIISVCAGITASNIANNGGDMVFDATGIAGNDGNGVPLANMSADNILQAKQTMGDTSSALGIIAMHSVVFTNLERRNLIQYLRDSDMQLIGHTYLGYRIVQDDGMPVSGVSPNFVYTSYMYAPGYIRWGTGTPKTPTELFRTPNAGNGEGEDTFYNRQHWVGHPTGFNYTLLNAGAPQFNPTNTQLATAAAWNRVWARKQVPFVAIKTKG